MVDAPQERSTMPFRLAVLILVLSGCAQQAAPIYSPLPGGHDALSKPPASLTSQ